MGLITKERTTFRGRIDGCKYCGRKRGLVRRYGLNVCRQCFWDNARELGFKKYN